MSDCAVHFQGAGGGPRRRGSCWRGRTPIPETAGIQASPETLEVQEEPCWGGGVEEWGWWQVMSGSVHASLNSEDLHLAGHGGFKE